LGSNGQGREQGYDYQQNFSLKDWSEVWNNRSGRFGRANVSPQWACLHTSLPPLSQWPDIFCRCGSTRSIKVYPPGRCVRAEMASEISV